MGMFRQYHVRHARIAGDGSVSRAPWKISDAHTGDRQSNNFRGLAVSGDAVHVVWERFLTG